MTAREYPKQVRIVMRSGAFIVGWVDEHGSAFVATTCTTHADAVRIAVELMGPNTDFEDTTGLTTDTSGTPKN